MRCRLIVSGRVQGVCYRFRCRDVALGLGLRGFVRNRPDGTVEVVAEGDKTGLDKLIEWCKKGPPAASVEDVRIKMERKNEFSEFSIQAGH
ncbi:MAG: acylphosphatase [archaeon]